MMTNTQQDMEEPPVDRISALQSQAKEPKWPIYLGGIALVGFLGGFAYVQFGGGGEGSVASLIPVADVTPTERPENGDLFGALDLLPDDPDPTPASEPLEDPRVAELAAQVAELQALLAAQRDQEPAPQTDTSNTSALEAQIAALLTNQESLQGQLRAMEMRLQAQASRNTPPAPSVTPAAAQGPDVDPALLAEEQRRRQELEAARQAEAERLAAPAVIYSGGAQSGAADDAASSSGGSPSFLARSNNTAVETAYAAPLGNPARMVPQGTIIPAVLETAINSDLPGLLRARVTYDVWSHDASEILIPRGSMLIGEYDSNISLGASRIQVAWNRVITTNNKSIMIGSRGTDSLGRAGLTGDIDHRFDLKFEAAFFVSVLTRIAGGASPDQNVSAGVDRLNDAGMTVLDEYLSIPPSIAVQQGAQINVFVARDLVF